jgi:IS1 family transposase
MITSDDWGSYAREVLKEKHLTGNIFTQRIERHEKIIAAFIEKYMFDPKKPEVTAFKSRIFTPLRPCHR